MLQGSEGTGKMLKGVMKHHHIPFALAVPDETLPDTEASRIDDVPIQVGIDALEVSETRGVEHEE
jgi:hypothetical protein